MHLAGALLLSSLSGSVHAFYSLKAPRQLDVKSVQPLEHAYDKDSLEYKFAPSWRIDAGCEGQPAVDEWGFTNEGFPANTPVWSCIESYSQMYARSGFYDGHFGIMYSLFIPKTEPLAISGYEKARAWWVWAVVWLTPDKLGIDSIYTGGSKRTRNFRVDQNSAIIGKGYIYGGKGPEFSFINTTFQSGETYLLAEWDKMPLASKYGLNNGDFYHHPCPVADGPNNNFDKNMELAWVWKQSPF